MNNLSRLVLTLSVAPLLSLGARDAVAQSPNAAGTHLTFATRAQIDSLARVASDAAAAAPAGSDAQKARQAEAAELRQRLAQGDFAAGDRLIVRVAGQPTMSDTFTVREGTRLQLPGIPDIPLTGALRSEAEARVRSAVATYFREPEVVVVPLVRVSVTGSVARSGFYALPADILLSDAIMAAGGPTSQANLAKVELLRGDRRLYSPRQFSSLVQQGYSLDQAHIRAGDEIHVGEKNRSFWPVALQVLGAVTAVVTIAIGLSHTNNHN